MQITSSRFSQPQRNAQTPKSPSGSSTFLNEPHVPMDAVMRGYEQMDFSKAKDVLSYAALGAAGGALAGAAGQTWMVPANIASSAAIDTAATYADIKLNGEYPLSDVALAASPVAGAATGLVGGALGLAVSALTGLNPVVSGAITGAVTHGALAAFG